jgi:gamma-glutamyl:cysteine ligase YbdK (ATP-grasp superfamily)
MPEGRPPLRLFEGHGVELEYMIVGIDDLNVRPISDRILEKLGGGMRNEVEVETVSWSNELVLHVIELKNTLPAPSLAPLGGLFSAHVRRMNALLEPEGAMLMPGAMHPWMSPAQETRLWPHEGREIYEAFHAVFDCRRHGWANLQSAQLNLSFGDDEEFGRLHAAIRLVLPVVAALGAASPVADGEVTGLLDTRLEVYRTNSKRFPAITGSVIPEPVFRRRDYEKQILEPMYEEMAPHDPGRVLSHPWLNARGAIAQFARDAIEIRVLDAQECPAADVAILRAVSAVVRALVEEELSDYERQKSFAVPPLAEIFVATLREAERTVLRDVDYLRAFGFPERDGTARDLWQHLVETLSGKAEGLDSPLLEILLDRGPLARRILRALGSRPQSEDVASVYRALCDCLERGEPFLGA